MTERAVRCRWPLFVRHISNLGHCLRMKGAPFQNGKNTPLRAHDEIFHRGRRKKAAFYIQTVPRSSHHCFHSAERKNTTASRLVINASTSHDRYLPSLYASLTYRLSLFTCPCKRDREPNVQPKDSRSRIVCRIFVFVYCPCKCKPDQCVQGNSKQI